MRKINRHFLHSFFFIMFIFSGMIKWAPFPVDPTVLFLLLTFITSTLYLRPLSKAEYPIIISISIFVLFSLWLLFSISYTSSGSFVWEKLQGYFLAFLAFLIPVLTMGRENYLIEFRKAYNFIWCIAVVILLIAYLKNGLVHVTMEIWTEDSKYPDYLVVGEYLGLGILLNLNNRKRGIQILQILSLFILIFVGGRGPLLILVLVYIIYAAYRYDFSKVKFSTLAASIIFLLGMGYYLIFSSFGTLLLSRFTKLDQAQNDFSVVDRFLGWSKAIDMIQERPLTGMGLGSFGVEYSGIDENSYPHNLFLEIGAETGIPGVLLFLAFLISIFYKRLGWVKKSHLGSMFLFVGLFLILQYMKSNGLIDSRKLLWVLGCMLAFSRAALVSTLEKNPLNNNSISLLKGATINKL